MSRRFIVAILTAIAIGTAVVAPAPVLAQATQTGSISGVVQDDKNQPLPGATVTVSGDLLPAGREFVADAAGRFVFPRLQPGTYKVEAKLSGMMSVSVNAVVAVDRDTQVELTMAPTLAETVTVTAVSPVIDTKATEVSGNFTRSQFEALPLARSYSGLFELAPGVAQNNSFAPSAGGSRQENTYLLDGINITNPSFGDLLQDLNELDIQEVNIKRAGITAEFGRTGGFVTNAITKSGTNRPSGQARFELIPHDFIAKSVDPTLTTSFDRNNPAVSLGGPIALDKAWFYGSGNWLRRTEKNRTNRLGSVPDADLNINEYFGKLTSAPSSKHYGTVSFRHRSIDSTNVGIGANTAPSVGTTNKTKDKLVVASWTWFPRSTANLDLRYTYNSNKNGIVPLTAIPYRKSPFDPARPDLMGQFTTASGFVLGGATATGQTVGGNSTAVNDQHFFRHEIKGTLAWFTDIGGSAHDMRFGFGFDRGWENLTRQANGWGLLSVVTSASQRTANCGGRPCFRAAYVSPQLQKSIGKTYSLFAQDRFTLGGHTTVSAGVLLNRDELIGNGTVSLVTFNFQDEVQPRLGIAFVPDTERGDKLYANYGRYYNMDNRSFARAGAPRRIFTSDAWIDMATGQVLKDTPRSSETGKRILPGLKPTYTDEFVAGYSRPLTDGWYGELWGMYRTTTNFIEDFPDPESPLGPRNPDSSYVMGNLNGGRFDPAKAFRKYTAVTFELNRPMKDHWSLNASYGWSRLRGNWDVDYAGGTVFFASSILHDGPGLFVDDPLRTGRLLGDRPHVVKLFASGEPIRNLTVGAYLRAQSGGAWQANTQDVFGGYRQYVEKAGSRQIESWTNLDLLGSYAIPVGGRARAVIEGRVLNVFDKQTPLTVDNRIDFATSFGRPTSYAVPRRFLLTFRADF